LWDGTYSVSVSAVDAAGNESARSSALWVTIDTNGGQARSRPPDLIPPSDTGVSSTDNITDDTTPTFAWDYPLTAYFRFYRGYTQISGDWERLSSDGTYTAPPQPNGTYGFKWAVVDLAGNQSTFSPALTVTIDTTAPTVRVNRKTTSDTTPELTGTVNNNAATIKVMIDGRQYDATNDGDGTWTLPDNTISSPLSPGTYDVQAKATDPAGNEGTDSTTDELTIEPPVNDTMEMAIATRSVPAVTDDYFVGDDAEDALEFEFSYDNDIWITIGDATLSLEEVVAAINLVSRGIDGTWDAASADYNAETGQYALKLTNKDPGDVCFVITNTGATEWAAALGGEAVCSSDFVGVNGSTAIR
jgi:hypothetical protein